ncbi:hypothetical protein AMS58_15005 [Pseudoalteromonas porphyrae]|uniref:hypothetical protein n=1 Tax=Pseudoalteromonas TaxID=53246 RepID=UPI0006BAD176|nr:MULTISPECIES: hypothetical protein [Pseudoalteromonas]KPH93878.1 hypothetical protein AMS58_15005 [Pseudoalteromonas porphyrae]
MNWDQLGYLCRIYSSANEISDSEQNQLRSATHLNIYKQGQPQSQLATKLAKQLVDNPNPSQQKQLSTCYAKLPSIITSPSFDYKNKLGYLAVLFGIFIVISAIYQVFVIPAFIEILGTHNINLPHSLNQYAQYWYVAIVLLAMLFTIVCITILKLHDACNLASTEPFTGMFGVIIPKQIKQQYAILMAIFGFFEQDSKNKATLPEIMHLQSCQLHGLALGDEFAYLVEQKLRLLNDAAKKQINKLIYLFSAILVLVIYLFLQQAYKPIFIIGEIV